MQEADELQAAIAALLVQARPRLLARVEALLTEPDREKALAEAHALTGTLGSFGVADAGAAERALEAGDREALAAAVERLRAALQT